MRRFSVIRTVGLRVGACLLLLCLVGIPVSGWGQDSGEDARSREVSHELQKRIHKGLDHLVSRQGSAGEFGDNFRLASTSLAGLALLSSGSTYTRGPYAENLQRAVRWIVNQCAKPARTGVFFSDGETSGRMHAHGYAVLFLTQVYGTIPSDWPISKMTRDKIEGGIELILDAQTEAGGWGYYYRGEARYGMDEASVTITQVQALRAARNIGIQTEATASRIAEAIDYVKESQKRDGSFQYSLNPPNTKSSYELTAAAVSTLNATGVYASDELAKGLTYLRARIRKSSNPAKAARNWYYYGNLYAAQAMWQSSEADWNLWFRNARTDLLSRQNSATGAWSSKRGFGDVYATAVACIILQIQNRYLPVFQK